MAIINSKKFKALFKSGKTYNNLYIFSSPYKSDVINKKKEFRTRKTSLIHKDPSGHWYFFLKPRKKKSKKRK